MAQKNEIKFALEFPQGRMLFMKNDQPHSSGDIGGVYFLPYQGAEGFMVWGERKELFGKNAVSVREDDNNKTPYSVVYEFADNGALSDARLVTKTETARGALADDRTVQTLNAAIARGAVTLHGHHDMEPVRIFNVARFPDGRLLIQLADKDELYLGKPGNYEKLDAKLQAQGGCSMYYKLATGERVELPYSFGEPGPNDTPTFNGEELVYLKVPFKADPAKFGLDLASGLVPLNPFSPGLPAKPADAPKPVQKTPGM